MAGLENAPRNVRCNVLMLGLCAKTDIATAERRLFDKHLASTLHCVDDEIIGWLERRERRKRDRLAGSQQSAYKYPP